VTEQEQVTPEAETPEPVEETVEAVEAAPKPKRAPRKPKIKTVPEEPAEFCDNHPDKPAVLSTTRGGKIRRQRFCDKCLAKLPFRYADG
jgi:hypothetical protein